MTPAHKGLGNDRLTPEAFYTYHIVFVPDLTQKYGLKINGGVGEIRAAMNLVNGWQFTGVGPFYMKDSSTAQNILASGITANLAGRAVGDVVKSILDARLAGANAPAGGTPSKGLQELGQAPEGTLVAIESLRKLDLQPLKLENYAEI